MNNLKSFFHAVPLPISAVALSLIGLSNLSADVPLVSRAAVLLAVIILVIVTVKLCLDWPGFLAAMSQAPAAATFPTYSMALILLSKALTGQSIFLAKAVWGVGIAIHLSVMIWFTKKFVWQKSLQQVLPAWFIVYVGIVTVSMTAGVFQQQRFGQGVYWFGLLAFLVLLPLVSRRLRVAPLADQLKPTAAILAAPASLILAGYLTLFEVKTVWFVVLQLLVAQALYLWVLSQLPVLIKLPFQPTHAALTFPLVISATALTLSAGYLGSVFPSISSVLNTAAKLEYYLAAAVTLYVLVCFISHVVKGRRTSRI